MTTRARPLFALTAAMVVAGGCGDSPPLGKPFPTPEAAAEALVDAAARFDVPALREILGPPGEDVVASEDRVLDSLNAMHFAEQARARMDYERDSSGTRVTLLVGEDAWPLPFPLVEDGGEWRFDAAAGRDEVLMRRVGYNELDAIEISRGYVEAQRAYASTLHDGATLHQYAQRIISTPGKQDGLAWQVDDSTWAGPVSEGIARAIADGYSDRTEPFHGYYYKVLKGQGPSAPLGEVDFLVQGAMIGGFALVAAPADYGVTGIQTFIVSHDGIVYQKDFGEETAAAFAAMDRYDPDSTWTVVPED